MPKKAKGQVVAELAKLHDAPCTMWSGVARLEMAVGAALLVAGMRRIPEKA